jgi:translation initiation factor 1
MAKRSSKSKKTFEEEDKGFQSSMAGAFAGLGLNLPQKTDSSEDTSPSEEASTSTEWDPSLCGKIVLRTESKGRGGKLVTVVRGLNQETKVLKSLAGQLRRELGCGGGVEADRLVLHGDQMLRMQGWLKKKGLKNIVLGNRPRNS